MNTALFFAEIALAWIVLFAIQIPARRKDNRILHAVLFIVKLLLIPTVAFLFVAVESKITYQYGGIFTAVYVALIGDSAAGIIGYLLRCIRKGKDENKHSCNLKTIAVLGIAGCVALTAYGFMNSQQFVKNTHEWRAEGLKQEHTFVFAADIHAGTAQPVEKLHDLCRQINEADPEFVLLGGDVTDELTTLEDMKSAYEILSEIEAPTYYIYGNHDRQPNADFFGGRTYSDEQLSEAIRGAGMTIVQDEYVELSDDLMLLGREDLTMKGSRKSWTDLAGHDIGDHALIVTDHEPYDNEQLEGGKSALQLSGHTHAGQLWPLQLFYRMAGYQAYGEFDYPGTLLYVSAGASDWSTPLRTEEHCEWDLITLKP